MRIFKCDKTCAWLVTLATLVKFLYCANKAVTRQERKQLEYNAVFACKSDTHIYRRSFQNRLTESTARLGNSKNIQKIWRFALYS